MHLFIEVIAVVLLAWIGYLMRELLLVAHRNEAELRDRCGTLYPVYSRADIELRAFSVQRAFQKWHNAEEEFKVVEAKAEPTPRAGNPVPHDLERAVKAMWEAELDYEAELHHYRFVIEGNIRVLNAQSTIQAIRKEWDANWGITAVFARIKTLEKRWAEFLAAYQHST